MSHSASNQLIAARASISFSRICARNLLSYPAAVRRGLNLPGAIGIKFSWLGKWFSAVVTTHRSILGNRKDIRATAKGC